LPSWCARITPAPRSWRPIRRRADTVSELLRSELAISGAKVASLAPLAKLTTLESAYVYDTPITVLSPLVASAPKLVSITVGKGQATDVLTKVNPKLQVEKRE
jgi:hypothetical protein